MKYALVLRPEPGNAATAARLVALGIPVTQTPLFAVSPVTWTVPALDRFDALLLTSANAVRHAGPGLHSLAALPVLAVGVATARAAEGAGFTVALAGDDDVSNLMVAARARGFMHPLHLAGRDRTATGVEAITVYRSDPVPLLPDVAWGWHDGCALLHSARAAQLFAALIEQGAADRTRIGVAAISASVLAAAGPGWAKAGVAPAPTDRALVACAAALIDRSSDPTDKSRP